MDGENYYTSLKETAKTHFYGRGAAGISFSEAFYALLPSLHAILRGDRRAHHMCERRACLRAFSLAA